MATLATRFKTALSRIEPEEDAKNAVEAHSQVSAVLRADDWLQSLGVSPVLIGSYGRDVSIKRIKDVDVFVRLVDATASLRPGDILDHVNDILEEAFPGCVERQHRSVKVAFPEYDLSVDVVIARPCVDHPDDHWQIPERIEDDGRASWVETNPTEMGELTTSANKRFLLSTDNADSGVYVPMVKLVRQVRRTWVEDQPGGYYFEVLTYRAFQDLQPQESTVAGYLCVILKEIADRLPDYVDEGPDDPTMADRTIRTKATAEQIEAAASDVAEAAALAREALTEQDACKSAALWRDLLGQTQHTDAPEDVFPLPEYCNPDGTTKASSSTRVKGAPAVPRRWRPVRVSHVLQAVADRWRDELVALGFSDDGERLDGPVAWTGTDGEPFTARVRITLTPVFPFAPPQVVILDPGAAFEPTFHVDRDEVLCLWEDDQPVDQAPWRDPRALLPRIADWMWRTTAGWPDDESCDLERYLEQDPTTLVLYDAAELVLHTPLRTTPDAKSGTLTITGERRALRGAFGGRRGRKDNRLAWVADIGAVTSPLRTWADVGAALGDRAGEIDRLISFGVVTLLLLRYTRGAAAGALALRVRRGRAGIAMTACESADTSTTTRRLRAGPVAPQLIDVPIAVIGCGAVGSFAADLLFRSGVRQLTLADGERLRPGNVVRHRAGSRYVGRAKTEALRAGLAETDPDVSRVRTRGPLVDLDDAVALVRRHHVVLDATGSARASSLLATAADRVGGGYGHSVVSVCVQRDGDVLRVDRMPLRRGETHLSALPPRVEATGLRERGCGSPISPTPPGAVAAAAELALRVVLDEVTHTCALPATVAEIRGPQTEPPFHRLGPVTSADEPHAGAA